MRTGESKSEMEKGGEVKKSEIGIENRRENEQDGRREES